LAAIEFKGTNFPFSQTFRFALFATKHWPLLRGFFFGLKKYFENNFAQFRNPVLHLQKVCFTN